MGPRLEDEQLGCGADGHGLGALLHEDLVGGAQEAFGVLEQPG